LGIEEAVSGVDRTARFEQTFLPHLDAAYNLARWLTGSAQDAADLAQESYLRAFEHYESFRGDSVRAWLLAIVRNTCYSHLRKSASAGETAEFDEEAHISQRVLEDPETLALRAEDRQRLAQALEELPMEFREVVVLRDLEEMSYKEIAGVIGAPVGTVMSRLARGRERLRQLLTVAAPKGPQP